MSAAPLRLGTRASPLARWQADWVTARVAELGTAVEQVLITTSGDVSQSGPVSTIGGQGVFTKEIQRALLAGEVDLAVHSLKDLPTDPVPGLVLAAVPERETTSDALLGRTAPTLAELPHGAILGTGSLRRQAQVLHVRSDLVLRDLRGNVETRLGRLRKGEYDAIILAEAGLKRLGLDEHITERLSPPQILPAIGQGALGLETRADDAATWAIVAQLDHPPSRAEVTAERALLAHLRGGCLAPVGARATWRPAAEGTDAERKPHLELEAVVLSRDGVRRLHMAATAPAAEAAELGRHVAERLLALGAAELIDEARAS